MILWDRLKSNLTKKPAAAKISGLDTVGQPFLSLLQSLYRGETQTGVDGALHEIQPTEGIGPKEGMWIYDLCRKVRPRATLEIGMAYGYSTLYFLAAAHRTFSHRSLAVDPVLWHRRAQRKQSWSAR